MKIVNCALCILLSACVASTRPAIKIGLAAPFEGRYREVGEEVIYAVRLAVREANESGGIAGYSIELTAFDDGGDAAQAEEQAKKFAADPQIVGVIGNWLDSTTRAAAPVLADSGIPFLATTSSDQLPSSSFRLWLTQNAIDAAEPDAIHCPAPCDSLEDLEWLTANCTLPTADCLGPPLWGLRQFPRLAGEAAEGAYFVAPAPMPADSADPAFADRYRTVSPGVEPRFLAVLAYDAARILFDAIERDVKANDTPTRAGVAAALAETAYTGLSGHFQFDSNRNWAGANGWVYQWKGGNIVRP